MRNKPKPRAADTPLMARVEWANYVSRVGAYLHARLCQPMPVRGALDFPAHDRNLRQSRRIGRFCDRLYNQGANNANS